MNYGGNKVVSLESFDTGRLKLASGVYEYWAVSISAGDTVIINELASYTIFCKEGTFVDLRHHTGIISLAPGDSVQVECQPLTITAITQALVLVSGVVKQSSGKPQIAVTRSQAQYRVSKPWGHELWISGEHRDYCFKEVFIRAGNRTSLQYHRYKQETNVIFAGKVRLVFKQNAYKANNDVRTSDLGYSDLTAVSIIDVTPGLLHQLEAMTDVLLYETSTPHLDDVIRVHDDSARPDGRIADEHPR